MQEKTLSRDIAEFVVSTEFDDLPSEVIHYTKRFFLNHLGCVLGGKVDPVADIVVKVVSQLGGERQSTIIGYGVKTSCAYAALANGIIGYALEMNDDHRLGNQHPVIATAPAVIAIGERDHLDGKGLIVAEAAGAEIMIRLGEAFLGFLHDQGFHTTGTCGVFGATAAVGKLVGLKVDQLVNALGVASSSSAGLSKLATRSGAWTKRFQGGHPAMCGILSALLAKEGFIGPAPVFEGYEEGRFGFFGTFSYRNQYDLGIILKDLGKKWELLDTSVKYHACCSYLAPVVDCALDIANEHDIKPEDVEDVTVKVCSYFRRTLGEPKEAKYKPQTVVHAQFSIPYGVGVAVCRRRAFPPEFAPETIKDSQILKVASKVKIEVDPEAERRYPKDYLATVDIRTKDGNIYSRHADHAKGNVENPVTDEELEEKFRRLTEKALTDEKAKQVIEMVWKLDELKDIAQLIDFIHK